MRHDHLALAAWLILGLFASAGAGEPGVVPAGSGAGPSAHGPYQATGIKIGEVTDSLAIIWTRLTLKAERNPADGPMVRIVDAAQAGGAKQTDKAGGKKQAGKAKAAVYPPGVTVADIRDAAPGAAGEVRVLYKPADAAAWQETAWQAVDAERDYTRQFPLTGLKPKTPYQVKVESRGPGSGPPGQTLDGEFHTAPVGGEPARVVFTVITGTAFPDKDRPDGYKIYPEMLKLAPDFFVHTGDIVYYDALAKDISLARYHWQRMYGLPTNVEFHRRVNSYFIKDDHDTWWNDCWPTMDDHGFMGTFTFVQGQAVFLEQVPMGPSTSRTVRWGKDLQVWMPEGRDFRGPNNMPDGPAKTIWGEKQKEWFKKSVQASDATFRVLISPTPLVGPDRTNKDDNLSNAGFTHEGDEMRRFIAAQKNMVVCCGDRHWQYVSVDPKTGLREYSCGPASDQHAGGWKQDDFVPEYHKYLNVIGGFLAGTVERVDGKPTLTFRHYDVSGKVRHEDRLEAK
jgi:alkaline phosphatase D